MTVMELLPMIIYILLIVLLIVLIILGIKVIFVVDKADKLIENVDEKINTFNPVFKLIDLTSMRLSSGVNVIVESIVNLIKKIFKRKEEDEENE